MSQVSKLLTEELVSKAKCSLKNLGKHGVVARKLQIIIAAKEHGITDVCRIHGISRTTLTDWIKKFAIEEETSLLNKSKKAKSPLSKHLEIIKKWIEKNSNITAKELVIKIEEKLKIKTSMSSVYRLLKKLKFSYITPMPKHYKQKSDSQAEFKKKSSPKNQAK
jgi:transposase